jgi:hypothetical protein
MAAGYRVIESRDWGMRWARAPVAQQMPVGEVFVHHTAGRDPSLSTVAAADAFKALNEYAINTKGYSAVDYSMLVHTDKARTTTIGEARGRWTPAATLDRNRQSKAVCLFGYFTPPDPLQDWTRQSSRRPFPAELEAVACAVVWMIDQGWVTRAPTIYGHRDNPAHPGATGCPGDYLYRELPTIRAHVARMIDATNPPPLPPEDLPMTFLWKPAGYKNVFLIDGGGAVHCSPTLLEHAQRSNVATVPDPTPGHPHMLKSVLYLAGIDAAELVKE